jgi:crossover junction endodeoxyribonuclease RusA
MKLVLPYPVSANRYWRSFAYIDKATRKPRSVTVPSDEAKAYKRAVGWIAKGAGCRPSQRAMALVLTLCPRMNKDGSASGTVLDLTNCVKVAEDALQGIVYENDKQVQDLRVRYGDAVENGALIVEVTEWVTEPGPLFAQATA